MTGEGSHRILRGYPKKYECLSWNWNRVGSGNGRGFWIEGSIQREKYAQSFRKRYSIWVREKDTVLRQLLVSVDELNHVELISIREGYRTVLWTLWERERVGRFGRMALKHVKYHVRNELSVQVRCTKLDAWGWCTGTTQRDGMGREEGSGWGTHVYLWRIHFDVWQN